MRMNWKAFLGAALWALAGLLRAQDPPIGERVRLTLRSGEEIVGVLKASSASEIQLETAEGLRTIPAAEVEKAVVLEEEGVIFVRQDPGSHHRVEIFSAGVGWGYALEALSYEYITDRGWGFKVSPLNIAYRSTDNDVGDDTETFNYAPLWLRRHFGSRESVWPYVGVGLSFKQSSDQPGAAETERKMAGAGEVGLNLSGWIPRLSTSVKYFPGPEEVRTVTFNVAVALGTRKNSPASVP